MRDLATLAVSHKKRMSHVITAVKCQEKTAFQTKGNYNRHNGIRRFPEDGQPESVAALVFVKRMSLKIVQTEYECLLRSQGGKRVFRYDPLSVFINFVLTLIALR